MKKKDFKATLNAIEIYCACRMSYDNTNEDVNVVNILSVVNGTMLVVNITNVEKYKSKDWFCKKCKWFLIRKDFKKETNISIML